MLEEFPFLAISDRQDLYSMAYIRALIAVSGFNFSKSELDRNSDDLFIELSIRSSIPEYSRLIIQVKCTYSNQVNKKDGLIHFDLPVKNYDDLRGGLEPKLLVVVVVPRPDGNPIIPWIESVDEYSIFRYRAYWKSLFGEAPTQNKETTVIKIPISNTFDVETIRFLMDRMVVKGIKTP
jgi:hypothetical protein